MDRCLPQPQAGPCVPPPAPSMGGCASGVEAFMVSMAHLPGTTRAWAASWSSVSPLPCPAPGLSQPGWGTSLVAELCELGLEWKAPVVGDGEGDPPPLCPQPWAEAMALGSPRTVPSLLSLPSAPSASCHYMSLL